MGCYKQEGKACKDCRHLYHFGFSGEVCCSTQNVKTERIKMKGEKGNRYPLLKVSLAYRRPRDINKHHNCRWFACRWEQRCSGCGRLKPE